MHGVNKVIMHLLLFLCLNVSLELSEESAFLKFISMSPETHRASQLLVRNPSANSGDARDTGSIPVWGRSPGGGDGNPLQYSCLGNSMDRRAWQATVHEVTDSLTPLSHTHTHTHTHTQGLAETALPCPPQISRASRGLSQASGHAGNVQGSHLRPSHVAAETLTCALVLLAVVLREKHPSFYSVLESSRS